MVTTDGVLKIVDFDLAAIGRTEWRENPWHRRPSQQSSDEDLELRACKLALENGWSKTESNDELAVDKEMGELRDLVKDLVDAQYKAKQGRVACLVSFDSAVRKAQNACSEFCLVRDKPSRQFPQVVELCEIEHTLNRQVEDVLDERYELDLYASLTGVTQMMQSAEVKELHSKLEDTRSLRTHEELKHKFSVTPRVTDLWSAGLVVLQMFEGSGLVRGFPPWACQRNDILPSGGERAHEELTRFLSKYRKSSEDVRSWDIEEVVDWVSLCDELNDEDTHLVDLVRTCRVPGADLVDLADQSIRVIKTRLPGISAPSAKRLKRAIKSNFATIDMPMLLQELLADMFGRVPTDRPKTEICLARLEELRAKYHATETPVRHITYDNIAFTLRNLGRAFEHEKDGQAAVEAYASWLVKAKNNAEHHEEAIDGILRVLRNREMNVRVIDLSQANHQHLTRDEFDRICCALVDGNGVGEFNIEGVGITGRIPGILAKAKRLGKLCFARNSFEGRLPIRLACRFWLNSDMLQIEGNPKLGGLLTNHFPLTLSGVLGGMSICVLFTLECLIVIFFLVEAALQEHQVRVIITHMDVTRCSLLIIHRAPPALPVLGRRMRKR